MQNFDVFSVGQREEMETEVLTESLVSMDLLDRQALVDNQVSLVMRVGAVLEVSLEGPEKTLSIVPVK